MYLIYLSDTYTYLADRENRNHDRASAISHRAEVFDVGTHSGGSREIAFCRVVGSTSYGQWRSKRRPDHGSLPRHCLPIFLLTRQNGFPPRPRAIQRVEHPLQHESTHSHTCLKNKRNRKNRGRGPKQFGTWAITKERLELSEPSNVQNTYISLKF